MKQLGNSKPWRRICSVVAMLALLFSQWSIPVYPASAEPFPAEPWSVDIPRRMDTADPQAQLGPFLNDAATTTGFQAETQTRLAANTILYVDTDATGNNNGTSWAHAFTDLQDALSAALPIGSDTVEIWVAEGMYKPTDGVTRTLSFQLKNNVSLYGGFAGTETDRSQRDVAAHPTILSGDLQGNDNTTIDPGEPTRADNSYHVLLDGGTTAVSTLDGFTITGGNANGSSTGNLNKGGGMLNTGDGTILQNITFKHNTAAYGGGLYNNNGAPTLHTVTFLGNRVMNNGGGMYSTSSKSVNLTNVAFFGNTAGKGAGVYGDGTALTLINVVFSGNAADYEGGGIANYVTRLTLINVTFSGNTAISTTDSRGGGLANYSDKSVVIANTIFWGNQAPDSPLIYNEGTVTVTYSLTQGGVYTGTGNISTDPLFADADGGDNTRGTFDDDVRLRNTSPAIDAGDNDAVPVSITTDLAGAPRFVNHPNADTGHGTPPIVDMGAYEKGTSNQAPYTPSNPRPALGATNVSPKTLLSWSGGDPDGDAVIYTVAFGTSSSPPVVNSNVTTAIYNPGTLITETTYYWQITATDGMSVTAGPLWSFTTASDAVGSCILYPSTDTPRALADYGTITSTLAVADSFSVGDVNVTLNIDHTFDEDLRITLVAPDGSRVILVDQVGSGGDNFINTVLDDEAAISIASGTAPFTGRFRPSQLLSALDDKASSGSWRLVVTDLNPSDTGTLNSWQLELCSGEPGNHAPYMPSNPWPPDGAINIPTTLALSWDGGDPDLDLVTYTVAFGESDPPPVVNSNVTTTSYNPGALSAYTLYYWQITATDGLSITVGPVWDFTTAALPPGSFGKISPTNAATGVSTSPTLSWGASSGATSYEYCYSETGPTCPDNVWTSTAANTSVALSDLTDGTTYYWQARAVNTGGTTEADSGTWWSFTTANVNDAPFFTSSPVTTAVEGTPYTYTVTADDPDLTWGDVLTITAPTLPAWLTLTKQGEVTATLTGTPAGADVGDHAVVLHVTDSEGLMDTQSFTITVAYLNDAPFFTSTPVTTATQNVLYTYAVTADDPDLTWGDVLTITAPTRPAWLTFTDNGDGTATLSGTPADLSVGDHAVVLRVTDSGGLEDTQAFTITVANANDAPFFTSTPVTTAQPGTLYTYDVTTDDPDLDWGDVLTITAPTLPTWLTLTKQGAVTATLSGTPASTDAGEHAVELRVTDSGGLMATQAFTITVTATYRVYLPLVLRNKS